jgi:spore germination protein GerM
MPTAVTARRLGQLAGSGSGLSGALLAALWLGLAMPASAQPAGGNAVPATTRLQIWFGNQRLNPDPTNCKAVFPVERRVPRTRAVATASLRELFAGPTPEETAAGYRSPFSGASAGFLKRIHIRGGTAYVDLNDLRQQLSVATSSCGAADFQAQVSRTLLQLPSIRRVIYAIDGEPRVFYDWMNESCGPQNDNCDARPFRRQR